MNTGSDDSSSDNSVTVPVIIEGQRIVEIASGVPAEPAEPPAALAAEPTDRPTPAAPVPEPVSPPPDASDITENAAAAATPDTPAPTPSTSAGTAPADDPEGLVDVNEVLALLTSLLVGSAIEGSNELLGRLREYEAELGAMASGSSAENPGEGDTERVSDPETSFDTLRYMLVGLLFDAQRSVGHGLGLAARATDSYLTMAVKASRPLTHNALTRPFQRRIDRLAARGQTQVARWIEDGRATEPRSRALARMTYNEIVNDFINHLAENPEVQALVTKQSLGLASEVRDEVRERTVTADNVVESLVRRILRREPRASLPEPDPIVQEWATRRLRSGSDTSGEAEQ